jgi:O-antigen/teichoic acid export membrane protein
MSLFVLLTSIGRTLILSSVLGPKSYGILAILLLIIEYGSYGHFGMNYEIDRELPTIGNTSSTLKNYLFRIFNELVFKTGFAILILTGVLLVGYNFSFTIVALVLLNVVLLLLSNTLFSIIRSLRYYSGYVWLQFAFPFISFIMVLGFSVCGMLDVTNALLGLFIGRLILSLILIRLILYKFNFKLKIESLRNFNFAMRISKLALLLFGFNFLFLFLVTWERYLGEVYLESIELGHYMFAMFGIIALRAPFSAMNSIVYPELLRVVENETSFLLLFKKVIMVEFFISIIIAVFAYSTSALIISRFFEEYTDSINIFRQLLVGFPLYVLVTCINMFLLCKSEYKILIRNIIISICVVGLAALVVVESLTISRFSVLNVASIGIYFLIMTFTVFIEMRKMFLVRYK